MLKIASVVVVGIALLAACGESTTNPHHAPGPAGGAGAEAGAPDVGGAGAATSDGKAGEATAGAATAAGAGGDATAAAGAGGESLGGTPSIAEGGAGGAPIDDWSIAGDDAGGAPSEGPVTGKIEFVLRPAADALVRINGVTKITAADGSFTFDDVPADYDLTVIDQAAKEAKLVEGLTTRHPVVVLGYADQARSAVVAGQVSGGAGFPLPIGHGAAVAVLFPAVAVGSVQEHMWLDEATSYDLSSIHWSGPPSIQGELVALQWQNGLRGAQAFTGFGRKPLTLVDGATIGNANGSVDATNIALTTPGASTYEGTLTSEDYYDDLIPLLEVGPFAFGFDSDHTSFSVLTPEVDLPTAISVLASKKVDQQMSIYVPKPAAGIAWRVSVPQLPTLIAPAKDAPGVTIATPFEWKDMPKHAIAHSSWFIEGWTVERVTRSTSTTIPDLSADGVPKSYPATTWFLDAIGPADKPEQSLALQAHMRRRQPVRHFTTYLVRVLSLTE